MIIIMLLIIGVHTCTCSVLIVVIYIIAMCKQTQQLPTLLAWENADSFWIVLAVVSKWMKQPLMAIILIT